MRATDAFLAFRLFLGVDMVQVRAAVLQFPGGRDPEPFLGSAVSFHLGHVCRLPVILGPGLGFPPPERLKPASRIPPPPVWSQPFWASRPPWRARRSRSRFCLQPWCWFPQHRRRRDPPSSS